jgi:hypothetical protein
VNVFVLGIVGKIPSKKDEVRARRQLVDHLDCTLECLGAQGGGRAVEAYVCVAELDKGEGRDPFAVLLSPQVE